MKCLRCGTDSKYKDRTNKTCPKCRAKFVFEPKDGDPVTDMLFQNAIRAVNGDGKVRWGVENLYYEVCRRKRPKKAPKFLVFGCLGVAVLLGSLLVLLSKPPGVLFVFALIAAISTLAMALTRWQKPTVPMDLKTFNALWDRWHGVGSSPGVIVRKPQPEKPKKLEADIGDYSFDRAVICDRARTVDLLVANNFHFENNCAVLSVDGYPKGPFQTIKAMLKRNPKLQVFAIHDATPAGCRMAQMLANDPEWFDGKLRVIDLGLRPNHAGPFHGLLLDADGPRVDPADGIREAEAEWLTKYKLELAAIRPEQVLKRLFHGLGAHKNDPTTTDGTSSGVVYCGSFESGGGGGDGGDGGGDAFG